MASYKITRYLHVVSFIAIILIGCSSPPRFAEKTRSEFPKSSPSPQPSHVDAGSPGDKSGEKILLILTGMASYYAEDFNGKQTSDGEVYDMNSLTAAHRTFPFGTKVRVVNLDNNRSVIVRINDRGPFHEGRILDLSYGAAKEIDLIHLGTAHVRLEVLEWGNGK
ncbi:MAG: septal ring lytic transglycosylase RlpA family protein [Bacteroidota bacterium]